jgi:hypothetical protein
MKYKIGDILMSKTAIRYNHDTMSYNLPVYYIIVNVSTYHLELEDMQNSPFNVAISIAKNQVKNQYRLISPLLKELYE